MNETITHEDRLVAAISHASIIVPLFGAVVPLIILLARGKESRFVRLHSLQGLVVDATSIILMILAYIIYFVFTFVLMIPMMLIPIALSGSSSSESNTIAGIIFVIVMLLYFLAFGIFIFISSFVIPIMGVVALIAAGVTLSGRSFRYPVLANLVDRKQAKPVPVHA